MKGSGYAGRGRQIEKSPIKGSDAIHRQKFVNIKFGGKKKMVKKRAVISTI